MTDPVNQQTITDCIYANRTFARTQLPQTVLATLQRDARNPATAGGAQQTAESLLRHIGPKDKVLYEAQLRMVIALAQATLNVP